MLGIPICLTAHARHSGNVDRAFLYHVPSSRDLLDVLILDIAVGRSQETREEPGLNARIRSKDESPLTKVA